MVLALALSAVPASAAAPVTTVETISGASYSTVHVTGKVDPGGQYMYWSFQTSTDGVHWSPFAFLGEIDGTNDPGPREVNADLSELKPDTEYFVRLAAVNFTESFPDESEVVSPGPDPKFTTLPVEAPTVIATNDATRVTYVSASVSGEVKRPATADPAFDTHCVFEYVTADEFADTGFTSASRSDCEPAVLGETEAGVKPVSSQLTGLKNGTTYHFRITASNLGGSDSLAAAHIFTTTTAPQVQALYPSGLSDDGATIAARINPANASVTYQFEWGPLSGPGDETYENKTPEAPEALSTSETFSFVTASLGGLQPATAYHYRLVAINTTTSEKSVSLGISFDTRPTPTPAPPCPNESSRVGASAGLPDCRAFEWVTPGINGSPVLRPGLQRVIPDGSAINLLLSGAPDDAQDNLVPNNQVVARRGANGWSVKSIQPPVPVQAPPFAGTVWGVSPDMTESIVASKEPLAGPSSLGGGGTNYYLHRADGSFVPLNTTALGTSGPTDAPGPASRNFKHIFFHANRQLPSDPLETGNYYEWVAGQPLQLLGVLPNGTPAPQGAAPVAPYGTGFNNTITNTNRGIGSMSFDGTRVLFRTNEEPGRLYLRIDGKNTVEVTKSQRTVIDPNPVSSSCPSGVGCPGGITADGSTVLFASSSELTDDANTGENEGVPSDRGADLYSYNVENGELTDLTVDDDPATGATVTKVLATSDDGSYIYFAAQGNLAPGGLEGENVYVWHNGEIRFVTEAFGGLFVVGTQCTVCVSVSADGRHFAFVSSAQLTGYDNRNPVTGQREPTIYSYSYGEGIECASCRPSGEPPIGSIAPWGLILAVINDGTVFFQSGDGIVSQDTNGLEDVYEYHDGQVSLLTSGTGEDATYLWDVTDSGSDVFVNTHNELGPERTGHVAAVFDARINANTFKVTPPECEAEGCRGIGTTPPSLPSAGTVSFEAPGSISIGKPKRITGAKTQLRVNVPSGGQVSVSGAGLKPVKKSASQAGTTTLVLVLTQSADKARQRKGVFRTSARVVFTLSAGDALRSSVSLKFEAGPRKEGGK